MNILRTQPYAEGKDILVNWIIGFSGQPKMVKGGVTRIVNALENTEMDQDQALASAELQTIWFIFKEKFMFGEDRSGSGLTFAISNPKALSFLQNHSTSDRYLIDQYYGMSVYMLGATFIKNNEILDFGNVKKYDALPTILTFSKVEAVCYSSAMKAKVSISVHALERFAERTRSKNYGKALKTLIDFIAHRKIEPVKLPKDVANRKKCKYDDIGVHYSLSYINGIRGVFVYNEEKDFYMLITVYDVSAYYLD